MNNNAWFKKEKPLLSLQGMSGGAAGSLMQGAASDPTYIDDVFKTWLYTGAGQTQTITNGMDLSASGDGGMVWIKCRSASNDHNVFDTVRGVNKVLSTSQQYPYGAEGTMGGGLQQFNSDGWQFGYEGGAFGTLNASGATYSSWTFMKKPGFLDIVTYTGTGSAQNISHSLGSIPGVIIIKGRNNASQWTFWHKDIGGADDYMDLNMSDSKITNSNYFASTLPTSTQFTVGTDAGTNGSGNTYVAYIFAGGASTAATARSVDFDGTGDYLATNTSTDYDLGTGDFTLECWIKPDTYTDWVAIADKRTASDSKFLFYLDNSNSDHHRKIKFFHSGSDQIASGDYDITDNQWQHVALVRNSAQTRIYVNGIQVGSTYADTNDYDTTALRIGDAYNGGQSLNGAISNFRIVKGTAVYTSAFIPPTEPLTSISGTVLLCCNNSSVTGTTAGTVTAGGNPAASTDSPFDDPEGYKFGSDKDKNIIKMGKYIGNGSSTTFQQAVDINIGWEPQWLLIKCNDLSSENWFMVDSMRGIVTGYPELTLSPNADTAEASINAIDLTSTGFRTQTADDKFNGDGHEYIYMAIRRPDGYVGKPPEAGNEVFAMDTGNASTTIPVFDSGFPVDFAMNRAPASATAWYTTARLMQDMYLLADSSSGENQDGGAFFDSNVGWAKDAYNTWNTTYQSWMWKRHSGFDVVTYEGDGVAGRAMPHSLNKIPEMMIVKCRTSTKDWRVYHKGLNGGTNPEQYVLLLNETNAESGPDAGSWNNTAPSSTYFTLGSASTVNSSSSNRTYIAMLFASVEGISKCGYYDGSSSSQTITVGFQPSILIVKRVESANDWLVLDTRRGWASGTDDEKQIYLNSNAAQSDNECGSPTSTGFQLQGNYDRANESGGRYIYWCHA